MLDSDAIGQHSTVSLMSMHNHQCVYTFKSIHVYCIVHQYAQDTLSPIIIVSVENHASAFERHNLYNCYWKDLHFSSIFHSNHNFLEEGWACSTMTYLCVSPCSSAMQAVGTNLPIFGEWFGGDKEPLVGTHVDT